MAYINMAPHQPCDSYFVETEDTTCVISNAERLQYESIIKRQRQERIADELSQEVRAEYLPEIVDHMAAMEKQTLPDVASIDIQEEIKWFMRPYLVDFLIEGHTFFQLLPETMFLAMNLLDRYCSRRVVYKRHYQLVGCAALLIAAKYGDRKDRVPLIRELKSMCSMLYDEEMFTQMEWHVLNTLDWVIGHPTVDSFLQLALSNAAEEDIELEHMAWYICEIALYHRDFVSTKPSVMARASLTLARAILGRREVVYADWGHDDNITLVALSQQLEQPSKILAKKYSSPYMSSASAVLEKFMEHQAAIARRPSPPTPPNDFYHKSVDNNDHIYNTPQKPSNNPTMANGYITPPITPEGDYNLAVGNNSYQGHPQRRPITPTPVSNDVYHHRHQQQQQQYHHYQHI
ncbi:hypothetical protein VC83_03403 [Pseudogymnoascus destructans]|uniref:Uncharacterized protein n=2 Tax=Pseudogymnoascus destructans TaxID=655981 RepID=L8FUV5_PSED2|nr:uncharacterized protein VC83_03403 [Pseudogymnoascus destructans]ELR03526.1 hypothetical protein GMDG_01277 [Pseudogymnoascus destructans 20631-21]OAF60483.1 hypothetical protein VC83_03403 [Pseudogymnoascus destructans]